MMEQQAQGQRMLEELESVDLELVRIRLGYYYPASSWLEDGDETMYYLGTHGELYAEACDGLEYVGTLSEETVARLR